MGISRMFLASHHCIIRVVVAIYPTDSQKVRFGELCAFLLKKIFCVYFSILYSIRNYQRTRNVRWFATQNPLDVCIGIGICKRVNDFDGQRWQNIDFTPKLSEKRNRLDYHPAIAIHCVGDENCVHMCVFIFRLFVCLFVFFLNQRVIHAYRFMRKNFFSQISTQTHLFTLKIANQYFIGNLASVKSEKPMKLLHLVFFTSICSYSSHANS